MDVIEGHLRTLTYLEENIEFIATDIVQRNADKIIQIIQEKQLGLGLYSDGGLIGTYSQYTQDYADADNISVPKDYGQPYNFQWTGSTFSKMLLNADESGNNYSIFTRDKKQQLLKDIYGSDLFKLTEANNTLVNETIIEPELIIYIEENWWRLDTQ